MMLLDATLLGINVGTIAALAAVAAVIVTGITTGIQVRATLKATSQQIKASQTATAAQIQASQAATAAQIKASQDATAAQIKASQETAAVDVLFRLIAQWQSGDMVAKRRTCARAVLAKEGPPTPHIDDVLGFFEFVGYLLVVNAVRLEGVWVNLSDDAVLTWFAYKSTIDEDQAEDQTFWEDFGHLVDAIISESVRRGSPITHDDEAKTDFLEDEASLGVGLANP